MPRITMPVESIMYSTKLILILFSLLCQETFCQKTTDLSAEIVVVLLNVTNIMAPHVIPHYEEDLEAFFARYFQNSSGWPGEIANWNVRLDKQVELFANETSSGGVRVRRRKLAAQLVPLETRCFVTAQAEQAWNSSNFASLLKTTIDTQQEGFLTILKESESAVVQVQFKYVNATQTFRPDEEVTTPRVIPDSDIISGVLNTDHLTSSSEGGDEDEGMSGGLIAGIVIACLLFVCLACWLCYIKIDEKQEDEGDDDDKFLDESKKRSLGNGNASLSTGRSLRSLATSTNRYKSQLGTLRSSSTSVISPEGKILSVRPGTSIRASGNRSLVKIVEDGGGGGKKEQAHLNTTADTDEEEEDVYDDEEEESSPGPQHDVFDNQVHYILEPPEQQQQQQQHHPTENNILSGGSGESLYELASLDGQSGNTESANTEYWNYDDAPSRYVMVPPGRLGIIVETRLAGPIINCIHWDSPLSGLVFVGDLITHVNDEDCRALSAAAITAVMVRTSHTQRCMTVKSPIQMT